MSGLATHVRPDRAAAGRAAGLAVAELLRRLLAEQPTVRVAFAAAPSQDDMLATLSTVDGLDWSRVEAFQLDDYAGLAVTHPGTFASYLRAHLFDAVRPGQVRLMAPGDDPAGAAARYADLLAAAPLDLVCLGIGENGHLAFNDPPDADRDDPQPVRVVRLDPRSRQQQVNDGCFATLAEVPTTAVTLTLPTLLAARHLVCVVPGERKRAAVRAALSGPIGPDSPASYLRTHPAAALYLDTAAAGEPACSV
ncbi:MAG TPA: glucosamine-6-phosphate deaminase [Actinocatenispora sp.]